MKRLIWILLLAVTTPASAQDLTRLRARLAAQSQVTIPAFPVPAPAAVPATPTGGITVEQYSYLLTLCWA